MPSSQFELSVRVRQIARDRCPHCGEPLGGHVCADRDPWSREEKDEMRAIIRRLNPAVMFAPPTARMQELFGARNRREREEQSRLTADWRFDGEPELIA